MNWHNATMCSPNRSEERFSRNAETDLVCRLLLEKRCLLRHAAGREVDGVDLERGPRARDLDVLAVEALAVSQAHAPAVYTLSLHDALPISAIRLLLTFVMSLYLLLRS